MLPTDELEHAAAAARLVKRKRNCCCCLVDQPVEGDVPARWLTMQISEIDCSISSSKVTEDCRSSSSGLLQHQLSACLLNSLLGLCAPASLTIAQARQRLKISSCLATYIDRLALVTGQKTGRRDKSPCSTLAANHVRLDHLTDTSEAFLSWRISSLCEL